jgi:small subunit ribosomal protein S3
MAVGETSGQGRPRRIVSAGGGRRRPELGEPGSQHEGDVVEAPAGTVEAEAPVAAPEAVPAPGDDALERLLAEEEEIERRTREQHHDLPHFRRESD